MPGPDGYVVLGLYAGAGVTVNLTGRGVFENKTCHFPTRVTYYFLIDLKSACTMIPFDFLPDFPNLPRFIHGEGCIKELHEVVSSLGVQRVLLVTDPGLVKTGHVGYVAKILNDAGVSVTVFDAVVENPTTLEVDHCVAAARIGKINAIIGLGGGSALDTAKGCNFILSNGGIMKDYWGMGKASKPMLPFIAIPTTAGTGSESQSFALIADAESHVKMACGDSKAMPTVAILDPLLTLTQTAHVTACTGVDALAHALESAVTLKRNPDSWPYSVASFRLCINNLGVVIADPENIQARYAMQLAAAYAGLAIERSMLGAAHAAANPLTTHYGIVHGQAIAAVLPAVIRYNSRLAPIAQLYAQLAIEAKLVREDMPTDSAVDVLVATVCGLLQCTGLDTGLGRLGVPQTWLASLADEAGRQWTAGFNPRPITAADFESIYQQAL